MEGPGKGLRTCTSILHDQLDPEGDAGAILRSVLGWEESRRLLSRSCTLWCVQRRVFHPLWQKWPDERVAVAVVWRSQG